ncbi:hypothetical protein C8035_v012335 [Colletotrichum spinosum]|uniref:DUF6536 domain-containing protein n=1 Tax=Colletotrichum spinosum TaxID=1347390 RepID=A0A4R8Q1K1_9PEZI|nr:hypothetical protein C8035_v012335 [Colletotrichum spinosum]
MPSMLSKAAWVPSGWRRAAAVNVVLMNVALAVLIGVLCVAISATGDVARAWEFYRADCGSGSLSVLNTLLHLLLNALSTVVLASSSFFMQVLNSPSRREVDATHARGDWLDIGIPSWRNAFRLSRFKLVAWLLLLLTSVPIHMVFNSSVFLVDALMGDYHVTIAAEPFVSSVGGEAFLPGASLATGDLDMVSYGTAPPRHEEYLDGTSRGLARNVSQAAAGASRFKRMEASACREMYSSDSCAGLRDYRNVVLVVDGQGWTRADVWNLSASASRLWDPIVPEQRTNTLWQSAQCDMSGQIYQGTTPICYSTCTMLLKSYSHDPWLLDLYGEYHDESPGLISWNASLYSAGGIPPTFGFRYDSPALQKQGDHAVLEVLYCLAEDRNPTCAVAVSKTLLMAVIVSVVLKVMTCVLVIWVLGSDEPLVTPGDAVSSFLSSPDDNRETGLTTQDAVRKSGSKQTKAEGYRQLGPTRWAHQRYRLASAVPRKVWILTTCILSFGIALALSFFIVQMLAGISLRWMKLTASDAGNMLNPIPGDNAFIVSVIVANSPQLYLSFWYLAYNSLITRLEMSREWASFSLGFCALRVTRPRGEQKSTYRLQLRYKYSITLLLVSIVLHWLLSNALFIIVTRGTYHEPDLGSGYLSDRVNLADDATVAMGTSSLPLLLLVILGLAMVLVPVVLARRPLPGYMPVVGSNSAALQAASRPSPLAKLPPAAVVAGARSVDTAATVLEMKDLIPPSSPRGSLSSSASATPDHRNLAFGLLKWGEVEMPDEWHSRVGDGWAEQTTERIKHLSFGTVLDQPQPPREGHWYA